MRTDQFVGSFEYQRSLQHSFLLSNTNSKNLTKLTPTHSLSLQLLSHVPIKAKSAHHVKKVIAVNIYYRRVNRTNLTIAVTKHIHNTVIHIMSDRLITQANSRLTKANLVVSRLFITNQTRKLILFTDITHQGGSLVLVRSGNQTRAIPHAPSASEWQRLCS
jgi:hypothetical protein